jgi:hypothetical protein
MSRERPMIAVRPPPPPRHLEAFVSGGQPPAANVQTPTVNSSPPAVNRRRRGIVARAGGVERARLTVYLDPAIAERLRRWAFEHGAELSDVAATAIEAHVAVLD